MSRILRVPSVLCILSSLVLAGSALASSGGINGFSGNPATQGGSDCTACHAPDGILPTVELLGPTTVLVGTTNRYTLRMSGGQEVAGGLDVSTTLGTLRLSNPLETQIQNREVTHTTPKFVDAAGTVEWEFDWIAPITAGAARLYGAGNSVDDAQGSNGDGTTTTILDIAVVTEIVQTPGESSWDPANWMTVEPYDEGTGNVTINFVTGCETDSNNVYYGPLSEVGSYGWSGASCDAGLGPSHAFDPGNESVFFVVVGRRAGDEGSYGRDFAGAERPPFGAGACGQTQNLSDSCDLP